MAVLERSDPEPRGRWRACGRSLPSRPDAPRPRRPRSARARLDSLRQADDGGGGAPRGRPLGPRSSARLRRGRLVVPVPFRARPIRRRAVGSTSRAWPPWRTRGSTARTSCARRACSSRRRLRCAAFSATTTSSSSASTRLARSSPCGVRGRRGAPRLVVNQQLRWHRTTLLGRIPAWCPPVAPVGPWRPILLESAGSLRVEEADVHVELDGDDGVVTRLHSGDMRRGAPR